MSADFQPLEQPNMHFVVYFHSSLGFGKCVIVDWKVAAKLTRMYTTCYSKLRIASKS